MPRLSCHLSQSLLDALELRRARTGESLSHIVMTALADALEVEHSTLFQVSTAGALVQGVFGGSVTVGALKEHGDFGIGTFDGLDGEMVAMDGTVFQVHGDGRVTQPPDQATTPFALVTRFAPTARFETAAVDSLKALEALLDRHRTSDNLFYAVRLDGRFAKLTARSVARQEGHATLAEAAAHQVEFHFADVAGSLIGFWSPSYVRSLNVTGWHLHFLAEDRSGGGHLLGCAAGPLAVQWQPLDDLRIAIPETEAFLRADLAGDSSAVLERAEHSPT
jgi:acetolactate decarboxylase